MAKIIFLMILVLQASNAVAQTIKPSGGCNQIAGDHNTQNCLGDNSTVLVFPSPEALENLSKDLESLPHRELPLPVESEKAKLAALRQEAVLWRDRTSPEYHNFLYVLKGFTAEDIRRLDEDDATDWNTLVAAAELLKWPQQGLIFSNMQSLPIYVVAYDSDSFKDLVSKQLRRRMVGAGFRIVDSYPVGALIVEIKDAYKPAETWEGGAVQTTTKFRVQATWIGGKNALFNEHTISAKRTSYQASVNDAVSNAADTFVNWARQH